MAIDLQGDWAAALSILRPVVDQTDFRRVALGTRLSQQSGNSIYAAIFRYVPPRGHDGRAAEVEVLLNQHFNQCHGPERVEILLWVAVVSYYHHRTGATWDHLAPTDSMLRLCRILGCACTAILEPSLRWTKLAMHSKPNPKLEILGGGWPTTCPVCERPVNSDERDERIHGACRDYARVLYVSAAEAQRREEAQHNAANLDR